MLFCTSLVALVGAADAHPNNSPRKLQIVNTKVSFQIRSNDGIADSVASIDHLRAHLPHFRLGSQDESKTAHRCTRV